MTITPRAVAYWCALVGNLAMLSVNMVQAVFAIGRGGPILPHAIGVTVASLGAWAVAASAAHLDSVRQRADAEIAVAQSMATVISRGESVAIGHVAAGDDERRH
jgi:hypothetical protein